MARHGLDNMNYGSPVILNYPNGSAYVYLTTDSLSFEGFDIVAPVRHEYHPYAACPDPATCTQRPYDVKRWEYFAD